MTMGASLLPPAAQPTHDGEAVLQALLDHRTDGMAVIVAGKYTYVNPALYSTARSRFASTWTGTCRASAETERRSSRS